MNYLQEETLAGFGKALYLHKGLVKRAFDAKAAIDDLDLPMLLKRLKSVTSKATSAANKLSAYNTSTTAQGKGKKCTR